MKFRRVEINNNIIDFSSKNLMIYSKENTMGKTTILRSIIFGLGNNTSEITDLKIDIDTTIYIGNNVIKRSTSNHNIINLNNKIYDISKKIEYDLFTNKAYNVDAYTFNLLLPTYYIDQDFGWRTINIGKIHPTKYLKMNLTKIVAALFDNKLFDELSSRIDKITKDRDNIRALSNVWNDKKIERRNSLLIKEKSSSLSNYRLKKEILEIQLKKELTLTNDLTAFTKIISNYNSLAKSIGEEQHNKIRKFILYEEKFSDAKKQEIKEKIDIYDKKIKALNNLESISFFDIDEKERLSKLQSALIIAKSISGLSKNDVVHIEEKKSQDLKILKSKMKQLKDDLYDKTKDTYNDIFENVSNILDSKISFTHKELFSRNTNSKFNDISGVKKGIIILLIRRYIRELALDKLDFQLPLIIDTLNNNDPSENSLKILIDIAKKMIGKSGAIFAAVQSKSMKLIADSLEMKVKNVSFKKRNNEIDIEDILGKII